MMVSRYYHPALRQLTDQLRYSPMDRKLEQVDRAEQLLYALEAGRDYGYQDLCERITGYRPDKYPDLKIEDEVLRHDLRMFVEDLSASANVPVESAREPVLTVEDVSREFNVSTKTVDRWRKRGLVSRKFKFGNRSRVGFLASSVSRFVEDHADEIGRGTSFSQVSEDEREMIVRRARELARQGLQPSEVAQQIADEFERAAETVRYTLKRFDEQYPEHALFPDALESLSAEDRLEIHDLFKQGIAVADLATWFGRTRTSIYRIVTEVRAELLLGQKIDFMDSEEFHQPGAEDVILGPAPVVERKASRTKDPPGLPHYLASLYTVPLLTREEEQYYFRKMNYLKFKAVQLRESLDPRKPRAKELDALETLVEQAVQVKNFLIRSNLRLVVSIAKKHMTPTANFFEMVSDGNMSLFRAIEKFDYTKGNKFSTYATWAIMKNYARSIPTELTRRDRFRTGTEDVFMFSPEERGSQYEAESNNAQQHQVIMSILDQLDERERNIIVHRYGLERGSEPETLEQVGTRLGVTKERIRQIESRAMQKLRKIAVDEKLDIPGLE
ncbi:MAG: sigma-70 family RNA polymerase sigma factor [Planctomycetaceae bacterium]|nr:sigma-70 family RNA polymerase sigma factor [Planctomycetaceae bacterium]